jgi:hypothetical protein
MMFIVKAADRDNDPIFIIDPSDHDFLLAVTKITDEKGKPGCYYLEGQAPGYVNEAFTANEFRQLVNQLVYWMLEVDPDYLSP